jgi:hypothetical protein
VSGPFVERMEWRDYTFTVRRQIRLTRAGRRGEKSARHMSKSGFHLSHAWPLRWGGPEVRQGVMHAHGSVINQGRIARVEGFLERLNERFTPHGHKIWVSVEVERYPELNLLKHAHYQFEVELASGGRKIVGTFDIPQHIAEAQRRLLAAGQIVEVDISRLGTPSAELMNQAELDGVLELGRTVSEPRPPAHARKGARPNKIAASRSLHAAQAAKASKKPPAQKLTSRQGRRSRPLAPQLQSAATDITAARATTPESRGTMPESSATAAPTTAAPTPTAKPPETPTPSTTGRTGATGSAARASPAATPPPPAPTPPPSTRVPRLKPTPRSMARTAVRSARRLLLPTGVWDIATFLLDQVLSYFEGQLSRTNQEQIERSFRSAVRPVEQEINRIWSMLDEDPNLITLRKPVYYCFPWQVVMEIQANDAADVAVFLARSAALRPGFVEVYSELTVRVPTDPVLRSAPWPQQEPERRARPDNSNLVDYFHVSCILIRHPKVTALLDAMVSAREGAAQLQLHAAQAVAALTSGGRSLEWSLMGIDMLVRNDDYQGAHQAAMEFLQQLYDTTDESGWASRQAIFDLANWCEESAGTLTQLYRALNESQRLLLKMRAPHYPPEARAPELFEQLLRQQPKR